MKELQVLSYHHLLLRAKWVVPVDSPSILDGAVEIKEGKIVRVGKFSDLFKETSQAKLIDFGETIILPCLANLHTHLELTSFRFRIRPSGSFFGWVKQVIKLKEETSPVELKEGAKLGLSELWREGVGIIGEVTNSGLTLDLVCQTPLYGYIFREIIGFKGGVKLQPLEDYFSKNRIKTTYSAHAPYTVSPLLLQAIKAYTKKRNQIFAIHCGESKEEVEFLKTGEGAIKNLLKERGQWNESFCSPGLSPVKYLASLNLLDEKTLLVHLVQLEKEDLEVLKRHKPKVCVCPRSNLFTGVGLPNLPLLLEAGLEIGIGTDSLASNTSLSVWEELKTLYSAFPDIPPEIFIRMATLNGAKILGYENLGAICPGYLPNLLVIEVFDYLTDNPQEMLSSLLNAKKEVLYRFYG
ncbi:amidohydrolase family protein [Thermodesulfobacterium sp. TA1]|uniref:amidohydrolase family protein n=1 Tax=Thermodesulfobacterium sp. TA1 TaxID=2234087 RepID=UPI001232D330|nr:amidohydrolase family protein [Thermodesulfobacterium sp. TA1]QER42773.1 amidohydrolase family protein [Thermodesulfobacterium sp. TA1]